MPAGPFGRRRVIYCDLIASGRSVDFIEDFIRKEVMKAAAFPKKIITV